ncbi:hypothetical protein AB0I28_32505 [Phytomonospora sp. NPDC050363]|uniref:hypothetical protein n=1 Tax=Phytomonospora sp. NPDC050363 TaxID=3155642 RepID=UPI0033D25348
MAFGEGVDGVVVGEAGDEAGGDQEGVVEVGERVGGVLVSAEAGVLVAGEDVGGREQAPSVAGVAAQDVDAREVGVGVGVTAFPAMAAARARTIAATLPRWKA